MAQASVAIAIMRNPIWFTRCIATALTPATGLDRRAQQARFCVSIMTLINRRFCRLTCRFGAIQSLFADGRP
jgi:polyferredoxin